VVEAHAVEVFNHVLDLGVAAVELVEFDDVAGEVGDEGVVAERREQRLL
jgi:hypothetical protein